MTVVMKQTICTVLLDHTFGFSAWVSQVSGMCSLIETKHGMQVRDQCRRSVPHYPFFLGFRTVAH